MRILSTSTCPTKTLGAGLGRPLLRFASSVLWQIFPLPSLLHFPFRIRIFSSALPSSGIIVRYDARLKVAEVVQQHPEYETQAFFLPLHHQSLLGLSKVHRHNPLSRISACTAITSHPHVNVCTYMCIHAVESREGIKAT